MLTLSERYTLAPVALLLVAACAGRGSAAADSGFTYREVIVEQAPERLRGAPGPRYPAALIPSGTTGRVIVRFAVTEDGSVDTTTLAIVSSTHPLFAAAVLAALPGMRFRPAEMASQQCAFSAGQPVVRNGLPLCRGRAVRTGERVRTTVQIPIEFAPPVSPPPPRTPNTR